MTLRVTDFATMHVPLAELRLRSEGPDVLVEHVITQTFFDFAIFPRQSRSLSPPKPTHLQLHVQAIFNHDITFPPAVRNVIAMIFT